MSIRIRDPDPDTDTDSDPADSDPDPYCDTGKTCLGGGMHCPSVSSYDHYDQHHYHHSSSYEIHKKNEANI